MTIAIDAVSADTFSAANVSSLTSAAFTIAGSDRVLLAGIASGAGTPVNPSGMKWGGSGGTVMAQIGTTLNVGSFGKLSAFRLTAPAAASQTLYGSWGSAQDETMLGGTSYTGVDQATPTGTATTATGTATGSGSTNLTVNVTTVVGDLVWACFFVLDSNGNSPLLTPNGTPAATGRYEVEGAQLGFEAIQIQEVVATGTTTTVSCAVQPTSGSLNADWGVIAFVVNPAAGGGGGVVCNPMTGIGGAAAHPLAA